MKAVSNKQSNITFTFGENLAAKDTPFNLNIVLDVFSKKVNTISS